LYFTLNNDFPPSLAGNSNNGDEIVYELERGNNSNLATLDSNSDRDETKKKGLEAGHILSR
jgi:hypothetical protein